ncbi:MAG: Kelch repeat-containing protein [Sandaracinaceae bacterium]
MATRRLVWTLIPLLSAVGCGAGSGAPDASPDEDAGPAVDCSARPTDAPEPRGEVNGVLDAARGRIVAFGGDIAAPVDCRPMDEFVSEVWAYQLDCDSWELLEVPGGPGIRARHATAHDTARDRMLVFGGRVPDPGVGFQNFDDLWAYDLGTDTWRSVPTRGIGPSPRSSAIAAYDADRDRLIVFGGNVSTSAFSLQGTSSGYALDLESGEWTEIAPTGDAPGPRLFHGSVVAGDRLYVYGGTPSFGGPFYGDLWALDLTTDTWRRIDDGEGTAPDARFGPELFLDAERERLIMAMGHDVGPPTGPGNLNDVWAFDLRSEAWSLLQPGDTLDNPDAGFCDFPPDFTMPQDGAPERRYSFVHVQDGTTAFVFGGKTDCGNINDVWALDLGTAVWTQRRPATGGEACNRSGRVNCTSLCF